MKDFPRWASSLRIVVAAGAVMVLLSSLAGPGAASVLAKASPRGTVTFAMPPGENPSYISPFVSGTEDSNQNLFQFENLLYRPLFWFGVAEPSVDYRLSIGKAPVYSNHGRTVTISMNHYTWSDGQPVTNRDVEFWMNLLVAEKDNYGLYVPGTIPDNLASMSFPAGTPYQFSLTFNRAYNPVWLLDNQLTEITPIPQQAWDRTSATSPVGNYDLTPSGAAQVFTFINSASEDEGTYTTNPLWKVVDGPWRLSAFASSTGYAAFVPNVSYTGPQKPHIAKFEEIPFTSDAAEFDALRSGQIDYGYLPVDDLSQRSYFTSRGFKVVDWPAFGLNYMYLNYTNPEVGPILKQLYIRQAMQHLINQPQLSSDVWHGTAYPTTGPISGTPRTPYESKATEQIPYPYSVAAAKSLLTGHGWSVHAEGTDTCLRPGIGSNECGAGIVSGTKLQVTLEAATGSGPFTAEMEAMQSGWSEVGIHVVLDLKPPSQIFAGLGPCSPSTGQGCQWQIADFGAPGSTPTYAPAYLPNGADLFEPGAAGDLGGYSNAVMTSKINATEIDTAPSVLRADALYTAAQLPVLWQPNYYYQVSVISPKLHGVGSQDPDLNIYPQTWTIG